MADDQWIEPREDESELAERLGPRRRRAVGLIAVAAIAAVAASAAYLNSTGTSPLGASPAAARLATPSPADYAPPGGGLVLMDPTRPSPPLPRTAGLLRDGAISVLIEQFGGMNDKPPLSMIAWVRITDPAAVRHLVHELNALPAFAGGIFCPMDDGSYFALAFAYARGTTTTVKVEARGCGEVFVGGSTEPAAWTLASPAFLDALRGLLAHPPARP